MLANLNTLLTLGAVALPMLASTAAAQAVSSAPLVAAAQGSPAEGSHRTALSPDQLLDSVRQAVEQAAQSVMASQAGVRVQTQVGSLSPQLKLAPCAAAEAHLQPGARMWGDIRIGLRCVQGPVRWNVYVPATIRVYGLAVVAAAALPPGHVLSEADLLRQEAEWTSEPGAPIGQFDTLLGRTLNQALKPGQALRAHHVRARQWFSAGQGVTLVARGTGFAITAEGVALTAGLEGQSTQVRLDNGRVVQGVAVGARRVDVAL